MINENRIGLKQKHGYITESLLKSLRYNELQSAQVVQNPLL